MVPSDPDLICLADSEDDALAAATAATDSICEEKKLIFDEQVTTTLCGLTTVIPTCEDESQAPTKIDNGDTGLITLWGLTNCSVKEEEEEEMATPYSYEDDGFAVIGMTTFSEEEMIDPPRDDDEMIISDETAMPTSLLCGLTACVEKVEDDPPKIISDETALPTHVRRLTALPEKVEDQHPSVDEKIIRALEPNTNDATYTTNKRDAPPRTGEEIRFESPADNSLQVPFYVGGAGDDQTQSTARSGITKSALARAEQETLIHYLRLRSAHLPGNNWYQDWCQFIKNNHPLLGLFFHHPLHPLQFNQRIYLFLASISFGLLATNCVYLYYMLSTEEFDEKVIRIYLQVKDGNFEPFEISRGMLTLWCNNGILHAIFDLALWHLSACTCFSTRYNFVKLQKIGSNVVVAISGMFAAISSFFILYRVVVSAAADKDEDGMEDLDWGEIRRIEAYGFLLGYLVELCTVYFVYNPILVTILFSGVLGCLPGLGGRPKDILRYLNRILDERNKVYADLEIV